MNSDIATIHQNQTAAQGLRSSGLRGHGFYKIKEPETFGVGRIASQELPRIYRKNKDCFMVSKLNKRKEEIFDLQDR